ncbi:hypothetical protein, partial [Asanoa siamensis]|uniref:hypothetical protein n=1 Tax=Asanoa siamensis TaxID=926357 RepID=UPI0019438FE4
APRDVAKLHLGSTDSPALALGAGVTAPAGSELEHRLIAAVLGGQCSEVEPYTASGIAGDLIKVLAPARFLTMAAGGQTNFYRVQVGHRHGPGAILESARLVAEQRLCGRDARFESVLGSLRQGPGTSIWSDTARAVASVYGPCWLATEIATIGAVVSELEEITRGWPPREGVPFGPNPDYACLAQARLGRNDSTWWQRQYDMIYDDLSRASWCLALIAVASEDAILANIERLDALATQLPSEERQALVLTSSRLGASTIGRRLEPDLLKRIGPRSTLTALLIAHHCSQTQTSKEGAIYLDPMTALSDQQLADMGAFGLAGWPALHGLSARMRTEPTDGLLAGLRAHGPHAVVTLPEMATPAPRELLVKILEAPAAYPLAWLLAAENFVARSHQDRPLLELARAESWFADAA